MVYQVISHYLKSKVGRYILLKQQARPAPPLSKRAQTAALSISLVRGARVLEQSESPVAFADLPKIVVEEEAGYVVRSSPGLPGVSISISAENSSPAVQELAAGVLSEIRRQVEQDLKAYGRQKQ